MRETPKVRGREHFPELLEPVTKLSNPVSLSLSLLICSGSNYWRNRLVPSHAVALCVCVSVCVGGWVCGCEWVCKCE